MTDIDLKWKADVFSADFCHIERRSDLVSLNDERNCENCKNAEEQNDPDGDRSVGVVVIGNDLPDFLARQDVSGHDGDQAEDRRSYHDRNEKISPGKN